MSTILDQIIATKTEELATRKAVKSFAELERLVANSDLATPLGFVEALRTKAAALKTGIHRRDKKSLAEQRRYQKRFRSSSNRPRLCR